MKVRYKNTVTEMKNAYGGHIDILPKAEKRIPELENMSATIESSKTEKQRTEIEKQTKISKDYGTTATEIAYT